MCPCPALRVEGVIQIDTCALAGCSTVGTTIGTAVRPTVGATVGATVRPAVGTTVGTTVRATIGTPVAAAVRATVTRARLVRRRGHVVVVNVMWSSQCRRGGNGAGSNGAVRVARTYASDRGQRSSGAHSLMASSTWR